MRLFLLLMVSVIASRAQDIVIQSSFESGEQPWVRFVPAESAKDRCAFSISGSAAHSRKLGAILSAGKIVRFAIHPQASPLSVTTGERYRVSLWVKAGEDFVVENDAPGLVVRVSLFKKAPTEIPSGHLYMSLKGIAIGAPTPLNGPTFQNSWVKLEAVFEIPAEARELIPFVFLWKGRGRIFVDDFILEKVDPSTPVSPLLH